LLDRSLATVLTKRLSEVATSFLSSPADSSSSLPFCPSSNLQPQPQPQPQLYPPDLQHKFVLFLCTVCCHCRLRVFNINDRMIPSSIFPQRPLPILAYHEKIKPALQAMDLFDTFQARRLNACRMAPPQYTTDAFINGGTFCIRSPSPLDADIV
jgi:hypothetical protein